MLLDFKCRNRLLLTGTPIQNTMAEVSVSRGRCQDETLNFLSSCGHFFILLCLPSLILMPNSTNGFPKTLRVMLKRNRGLTKVKPPRRRTNIRTFFRSTLETSSHTKAVHVEKSQKRRRK